MENEIKILEDREDGLRVYTDEYLDSKSKGDLANIDDIN